MSLRPLQDRLLVKLDPIVEKRGSLILPGGGRIRTGTVVRVGPGRWAGRVRVPVSVEPGARVAFFRENFEHRPGQQIARAVRALDEELGLLSESDILFEFQGEGTIE